MDEPSNVRRIADYPYSIRRRDGEHSHAEHPLHRLYASREKWLKWPEYEWPPESRC